MIAGIFAFLAAHPVVFAAASKASSKQASGFSNYAMLILVAVMIVVFYFFLIRPQKKRAEQVEDMLSKIEKGDLVVTAGGIHGTVKKTTDDTIVVEVDDGVRITFSRSSIVKNVSALERAETEKEEASAEEEDVEEAEEPEEETLEEPGDDAEA